MEVSATSQKIYNHIRQASNILLIAHQRPDADALGSMAVLSSWLQTLGKNHTKFCIDQPPNNLTWLFNFQSIISNPAYLAEQNYDLIIVLDSGDLQYAGVAEIVNNFSVRPYLINIDHHATNQNFGDINLVDPTAVSTTEIIFQLFKALKIKISASQADALLAGIIFDTYNFTNPNTNHQSLQTASQLLLAGASLNQISDSILKNKTITTLQIWGKILVRLSYNEKLSVVTTVITQRDLADEVAGTEVTEGIANFLNNLSGVKAALILQQEGEMVRGSLRTNDDLIDVSKLAKLLGGGGHRKAAGFRINGKLVETEEGYWQIV